MTGNYSKLEIENIALQTALAAVLYEAKEIGVNMRQLCERTKSGLFDSGKPYRWASAQIVIPAHVAIDAALQNVEITLQ